MESAKRELNSNPRQGSNVFSILLFSWTIPIFKRGYSKVLELEDVFCPLNADRSEMLGDQFEKTWNNQLKGPARPSLVKTIFKTFWKEYTLLAFLCFLFDVVIRFGQPYLLGHLLMYFRKDTDMSHTDAILYGSSIIGLNAISAITLGQFTIVGYHIGMKVRIAICSVIYRKALRLSQTALGDTAPGKVVNLLSNDVTRFDIASMLLNSLWTAPLMTIIVGYMLWVEVQWAGLIGITIVFIVAPFQSFTGRLSSKFRSQTALRTDERVRFMDEIISGVQVIKMYVWEIPFTTLTKLARRLELSIVLKSSYVRAVYMTFMMFTTRMAMFCTMLSIALLYGRENMTAARIFVISAYLNVVAQPMSQMFARAVAEISEALVAAKRIQQFLEYDEKKEDGLGLNGDANDSHQTELNYETTVLIKNATARWIPLSTKDGQNGLSNGKAKHKSEKNGKNGLALQENFDWKPPTLNNINAEFKRGKLIGVVGPVGAGKSSLLQALLRELPLESGYMSVNGAISYAAQVPWVFAGTVRQNILFGQDMDRERYDVVVKACALLKDFEQLENGDKTIIGERGVSLSGGQKARITLARACYRRADVYLLDDPLSAVDAHVGNHLFNECIGPKGRLARFRATRILVTHQVHFLKDADWVVIMREGKIEQQGSPQDLSRSGVDFAKLLESEEVDDLNASTDIKGRSRTHSRSSTRSASSTSLNSTVDDAKEESCDLKAKSVENVQQLESSSKGKVKGSVIGSYFRAGGNPVILFFVGVLFILAQIVASASDYWVSFWTSQEELRTYYNTNNTIVDQNDTAKVTILKAESNDTLPNPFADGTSSLLSTETCIYIHAILLASLFIITITRSVGFFTICVKASQTLHTLMFKGLISSTMRFFDTNPSGRILNRFSKDMGSVDESLPTTMLDATQIVLNIIGTIIVAVVVNPLFLVPIFVLSFAFIFLRRIYLKTSKNLKRLEGICRSPVFTHLSATLNGLSTVRAFNAESTLIKEFDNHQDTHTACWFMFFSSSSAFGLSLDIICTIFFFCVVFIFLLIDTGVSGDQVGLAITQVMSLTGKLQWGIRQSAEVANQMMSVERILEYRDLEAEKQPEKPIHMAKEWPQKGQIEFREVVYKYYPEAEPVLRGLSFVVQPGEKIGIVGRTGAGKSSLIGAIFRLAVVDGKILIDDVDTAIISLADLRSRVSIIPQDPVLFSGTLRRNLDPFEEYPDADIWKALDEVELKDLAGGPLGLQTSVMAHGSNFSVGQRQLLCLARAILRKNKILVLDEATANVDPNTDTLIQATIREKFAACTVLTVAHRLHTIIDSDRVLVMDTGRAIEFDAAHVLLQQPGGIFRGMVDALGASEVERIQRTARDKYESSQKLS